MNNIQKEYEQELIFQVEPENKKDSKSVGTKKIIKIAKQNLRKLTLDRLSGRSGEC